MATIITMKDCEYLIKIMNERNIKEICLGCGLLDDEYLLEGGYCCCDDDLDW